MNPDGGEAFGAPEYARAVLNILEDASAERARLLETETAVLNMLDDFDTERKRLLATQKAVLNILEDLASEKQRLVHAEQALRASLREKEVLLQEIHHRVKNNLQVISSLLLLQARYIVDADARALLGESQHRVRSIALVHEKLYRSQDLAHVELGEYVETLVGSLFETYNAAARGIDKALDAAARMTIDTAIPCGLIVNELVTNSLKHAFPSGRAGTVRVAARASGGVVDLVVGDDGVGLPAGLDPRRGGSLGLDLVFTLARQLKASVDVERDGGTAFRFRFRGGESDAGRT